MSANPFQASQALHWGPTAGGEIDLYTPLGGHVIDWTNVDSVPSEELSSPAEFWNSSTKEMATGAPEAGILPSASEMSGREPEADWNDSVFLGTPGLTVPLPPVVDSYAVEEPTEPTTILDGLDFFDFELYESEGKDRTVVENVNDSTSLNDFDNPTSSPKAPTSETGTDGQDSVVESMIELASPSNTNGIWCESNPLLGKQREGSQQDIFRDQPLTPELQLGNVDKPSQTRSIRLAKINPNFNVNTCYTPLSIKPRSWHIFTYTKHGELNPEDLFTAAEIQHYLWRHPLHEESNDRSSSPLILRIHRNPPASQDRYPTNHGSHRCRFHECPADNNTIDKGQFVVMFDEISAIHANHDPYLTAGYVHLYCIERFLDFPKLCADLNIQTEKRHLDKEPKNLMKLVPRQVEEEADRFIETCRGLRRWRADEYPSFAERDEVTGEPYEGTLTHRMHLAKLIHRSGAINKQEAAREKAAGQKGSSLGIHLGNLVVATALRQDIRKHTKQNKLLANPRQKREYKGDGVDDASENEHDDVGQSHGEGNERFERLRRPLPTLVTPTAHMLPWSTQLLGGDKSFAMRGNITPSSVARSSIYQLDENRKFIMPTEDLMSLDPPLKPRKSSQPQQRHQPSNVQPPANVSAPAPRVEHQQQRGPGTSRESKKRSSDEAGNDEAANLFGGRIAESSSQHSLDAGARQIKKLKESHTSIPSSLTQKQAHQRQALQKQANLRALPPPPPPPQQRPARPSSQPLPPPHLQAGNKRNAKEAGLGSWPSQMADTFGLLTAEAEISTDGRQSKKLKQTQDPPMSRHGDQVQHAPSASMSRAPDIIPLAAPSAIPSAAPPAPQPQPQFQKLPPPMANRKRTTDEAQSVLDDDIFEPSAKKPRISEQDFQPQHAQSQRAPDSNMIPSERRPLGQLGEGLLYQPPPGYRWRSAIDQYGPPRPAHPQQQHLLPGRPQGFPPQQQHPYGRPHGHHPMQHATPGFHPQSQFQQRPPHIYQPQQADTPEARRRIAEKYDQFVQQNSRQRNPKSPKQRKRPAEVLGNDGKVVKNKQRVGIKKSKEAKAKEYRFLVRHYGADQERLLRQTELTGQREAVEETAEPQHSLSGQVMAEGAEYRASQEWVLEQRKQDEQQEQKRQRKDAEETAEQPKSQIEQLRAEAEREARQRALVEQQDEAEYREEEERAARERELAKDAARQRDLLEDEDFLNTIDDDEA